MMRADNLRVFSGTANYPLAERIAQHLNVDMGKLMARKFSDGEIQVKIEESVRGWKEYELEVMRDLSDNVVGPTHHRGASLLWLCAAG